jgi:hypothetical protein
MSIIGYEKLVIKYAYPNYTAIINYCQVNVATDTTMAIVISSTHNMAAVPRAMEAVLQHRAN